MQTPTTCPRCGIGALTPQVVDEAIPVGPNVVQVTVMADVCPFCGERWFGPAATAEIDAALQRLRAGDLTHLTHIGEVYKAS